MSSASGLKEQEVRYHSPVTDPTQLFDLAEGMHAIEALTAAAAWLHLFEWLAGHPSSEPQICAALELFPRPARVLLTLLAALDLVERDAQGVYTVTLLAREHLLPDSPWSLLPCFDALKDRPACVNMLRVLRTGKAMGGVDEEQGPPAWAEGMSQEDFAEFFLNAIDSRNAYLADAVAAQLDLRGCRSLLDVGGGSGIYSCALARSNYDLRATVLEKPPVDAVARRAIERRGLSGRVAVVPGDMLHAQLPRGHDVHLYSNVIHDWDEAEVRRIFSASFSALPPNGRIAIHDALLDEDKKGLLAVAEYSVLLMAFTAGRCYSVAELRALLQECGFTNIAHHPTVVHRSLVTASKPANAAFETLPSR
jgi:2-polyprenyl-3-methyl-5-hydroxy-6-metoxy-1,4-benzoquinol methylase